MHFIEVGPSITQLTLKFIQSCGKAQKLYRSIVHVLNGAIFVNVFDYKKGVEDPGIKFFLKF